jgi:hypothetical protein
MESSELMDLLLELYDKEEAFRLLESIISERDDATKEMLVSSLEYELAIKRSKIPEEVKEEEVQFNVCVLRALAIALKMDISRISQLVSQHLDAGYQARLRNGERIELDVYKPLSKILDFTMHLYIPTGEKRHMKLASIGNGKKQIYARYEPFGQTIEDYVMLPLESLLQQVWHVELYQEEVDYFEEYRPDCWNEEVVGLIVVSL